MKRTEERTAEEQVRRFRRRLGVLLVLERGLRRAAAGGFLWGAVVLAARAGLGAEGSWLAIGLAATLAVAVAAAAVEGWRSRPAPAAVRALLDRRQGRGGLLMAGAEADLGAWRGELRGAALPRVAWRARPSAALAAGAAAFVAVAFLVPAHALDAAARRPLDVGREIEELARDLEVLAEEGLLEIEDEERLLGELETLAEEATGDDPARTWEALDHLRDIAELTAEEAAEAAFGEGESLAAAAEVAKALEETDAAPELRAAALRELATLTARAAAEGRLLDASTAEALAAAAGRGDPGELSAALAEGRADLAATLERLHDAGLIDLEKLLEAQGSLDAEDAALADFLDQNGLEASGELCFGRWSRPGRGGVSRGRGDAPMTWQQPITADGASFVEEALDPAALAALERSGLIGLQAAAPPLAEGRPAAAGAAVPGSGEAAGGAAFTQTVLPRHRGAVRRFFARSGDGAP